MKKVLFSLSAMFAIACTDSGVMKEDATSKQELSTSTGSTNSRKSCRSQELRAKNWVAKPSAKVRYEQNQARISAFQEAVESGRVLANGNIEVPVVVNVLVSSGVEVTDARIREQIKSLNQDFAGTNADISKVPDEFKKVLAGHTGIQFKLAKIVRKATKYHTFNSDIEKHDQYIKDSDLGGIDATDVSKYLNIWVVSNITDNEGDTTFGYATFPELGGGDDDGVVMNAGAFGKGEGTLDGINLGRTLTHEVGHYFDLIHIWGDKNCGDDSCSDTPTAYESHTGSPSYPLYERCGGVRRSVMFMNYMDYSDDASLYMFTKKQRTRMQATIAADGGRPGFR